jgi:hypothetical protein
LPLGQKTESSAGKVEESLFAPMPEEMPAQPTRHGDPQFGIYEERPILLENGVSSHLGLPSLTNRSIARNR